MRVKNYMSVNVITVSPEQNVEEIARLMKRTKHDGFPVVEGSNLVGIITARDLVLHDRKAKAEELMSREVVVTFPDTHLVDAARVMFRKGVSRLPVVDENHKLIGIVTNTDVIRSHIERVTPEKVRKLAESLEKLYSVKAVIRLGKVKIRELIPTQDKIHFDEFKGREYELKRGLAEPVIVVKSGERLILVDGHHRVLAALKIDIDEIDSYIIVLSRDIELGLEKTAREMGLRSFSDIKIGEGTEKGIAEIVSSRKKE